MIPSILPQSDSKTFMNYLPSNVSVSMDAFTSLVTPFRRSTHRVSDLVPPQSVGRIGDPRCSRFLPPNSVSNLGRLS
ncbi:hypothetical protein AB1N83_011876 [Pleurotus pulmonarius]